jgi:hypothetical protein
MSTRQWALECVICYGNVTVETLHALRPEVSIKTIQRAVANLQRDKLISCCGHVRTQKVYAPTVLAARRAGLDERRFRRGVKPGTIPVRLSILKFSIQTRYQPFSRRDFAAMFPAQAKCKKLNHSQYAVDWNAAQPIVSYLMVDGIASIRYLSRRIRREWNRRKLHQPFRDLMYHGLFRLVLITATETKAVDIRRRLGKGPASCDVIAVRGIEDFWFRKEKVREPRT